MITRKRALIFAISILVIIICANLLMATEPSRNRRVVEVRPTITVDSHKSDTVRVMESYERLMDRYMRLTESRISELAGKLDKISEKLNTMDKKLESIDRRLGRIEHSMNIKPIPPENPVVEIERKTK